MTPMQKSKGDRISMKYEKKYTHKLRRREYKYYLRGFRKIEPNDKQYLDESL